jgi:hypothetical protein
LFFVGVLKIHDQKFVAGSVSQRHGSADPDPDPYQKVTDPQHLLLVRVVDPDPDLHGSTLICVAGSGSRRAKMNYKYKKSKKISCFEVLDVLF